MKHEAWTWYLPSHLVPAKILCSRCETCTNVKLERMDSLTVGGFISKDSAPLSIGKFAWFPLTFVSTKPYLRF